MRPETRETAPPERATYFMSVAPSHLSGAASFSDDPPRQGENRAAKEARWVGCHKQRISNMLVLIATWLCALRLSYAHIHIHGCSPVLCLAR